MDETSIGLFDDVTERDRRYYAVTLSEIVPKAFRSQETIYTAGSAFNGIYIISFGATKTSTYIHDQEVITAISSQGDIVGIDSLHNSVYVSKVTSAMTTRALWIPSDCLAVLLKVSAQFRSFLNHAMGKAIAESALMISVLANADAEAKVAYLLLKFSGPHQYNGRIINRMFIDLSRAEMAEYLGIRYETLSRKLTSFSRLGHVKLAGRAIHIKNSAALKEIYHSLSR